MHLPTPEMHILLLTAKRSGSSGLVEAGSIRGTSILSFPPALHFWVPKLISALHVALLDHEVSGDLLLHGDRLHAQLYADHHCLLHLRHNSNLCQKLPRLWQDKPDGKKVNAPASHAQSRISLLLMRGNASILLNRVPHAENPATDGDV